MWDVYPEASAKLRMSPPVVGDEEKNVHERCHHYVWQI